MGIVDSTPNYPFKQWLRLPQSAEVSRFENKFLFWSFLWSVASASSSSCHSSNEIDDEDARTNSEDWKGTRSLLLLPNWMINAIQKNNQIHSDLGAVLRTYYLPTYLPTYLPKKHWSKQVGCLSWPWLFHSLMFRSRPRSVWIFKLEIPGPLFHFTLFFSNGLKNRTIDFSKIRTRIVRVQGEYTHHMTITRSQELFCH